MVVSSMRECLKIDKRGVIRLLQITDPHLFSNPEDKLLGVDTLASFKEVIQQIKKQIIRAGDSFDLILATGDLIQDHQIQGYEHFAKITKALNLPIFWLEGNHDSPTEMNEILSAYSHVMPHKHILVGEHWQILMLNTHVTDQAYGELTESQLNWLESKLAEYPEHFSLIVQHHNILPTNSAWLDQHSLKNAKELEKVLSKFDKVRAIIHGHIHQQVDAHWQGIPIFATPSTCIQFKPNCDEFTLDILPQGWREFYLYENGELETVVKRLNSNEFLPNLEAKGY
ncbi:MAG: 3',5'-cyclic-AMP phosphodiesterase [Mannheimia varigena]|nr:3',5'-cyclic-AMP phosphodiesterase [Mannheimia varigena]